MVGRSERIILGMTATALVGCTVVDAATPVKTEGESEKSAFSYFDKANSSDATILKQLDQIAQYAQQKYPDARIENPAMFKGMKYDQIGKEDYNFAWTIAKVNGRTLWLSSNIQETGAGESGKTDSIFVGKEVNVRMNNQGNLVAAGYVDESGNYEAIIESDGVLKTVIYTGKNNELVEITGKDHNQASKVLAKLIDVQTMPTIEPTNTTEPTNTPTPTQTATAEPTATVTSTEVPPTPTEETKGEYTDQITLDVNELFNNTEVHVIPFEEIESGEWANSVHAYLSQHPEVRDQIDMPIGDLWVSPSGSGFSIENTQSWIGKMKSEGKQQAKVVAMAVVKRPHDNPEDNRIFEWALVTRAYLVEDQDGNKKVGLINSLFNLTKYKKYNEFAAPFKEGIMNNTAALVLEINSNQSCKSNMLHSMACSIIPSNYSLELFKQDLLTGKSERMVFLSEVMNSNW